MNSATYTIIVGNKSCPNNCPICISKMTPEYGIGYRPVEVNWKKFDDATRMALAYGAKNVLLTGKGEPTLFPGDLTKYMIRIYDKPFATRELQTAGNMIAKDGLYDDFLESWKELGLNTVALSIYHQEKGKNSELFGTEYFELGKLIEKLHGKDINTRLSCVMLKDYIDSPEQAKKLIDYARENGVFQLSLRRADRPDVSLDDKVARFVDENRLTDEQELRIEEFVREEGKYCYSLPHGAKVFDVKGQNVAITTGLSKPNESKDEQRQFIFFPQGWLTTSWENPQGGRLL